LSPSYARLGRAASVVATTTFGGEAENLGEVENAWRRLAWKVGIHRTGLSKNDDEGLDREDSPGERMIRESRLPDGNRVAQESTRTGGADVA
jgi:hypothetical protein